MEDKREVWLLQEQLVATLAPKFDELSDLLNRQRRRAFEAQGRGAGGARRMLDSLYGATFKSKGGFSKIEAFMASFSSHAVDSDFEREHGLWSQWNRYAGPDGFCIVLDTAEICRLLGADNEARYWVRLALEPVRYSAQGTPLDALLPELVNASKDVFKQYMLGATLQEFAVAEFLMGSTLLKDANYREEREVRIVAIPGTEKLKARALKDYPNEFKPVPLPIVRTREDGKRYVTVFEGQEVRLPIARVIVGPAAGQEGINFARSLVGNVPVTLSKSAPP